MTIDKDKLKALAQRVKTDRRFCADDHHHALAEGVLALLAEIEGLHAQHGRDSGELRKLCSARDSARRQRDQLKVENEALRKQVGDDERKLDALLAHCDDGECPTCAQIICPHGGAMHFHHDGCPTCAAHEEAMAKEPSHG